MQLKWQQQALEDLKHIKDTADAEMPQSASQRVAAIRATATLLLHHPGMGQPGRIAGTHELPVPHSHHLLVYQRLPSEIQIIAIVEEVLK